MEDARKVVQQWSFIHCDPMKLKFDNKLEFFVVCPETFAMRKKEKKKKRLVHSQSLYITVVGPNILLLQKKLCLGT